MDVNAECGDGEGTFSDVAHLWLQMDVNAEGGDGEGTRNAAIQEAFTVRPAKFTVGKFISLACTSDHPLLQLLLREKATQYTSVPCFSELTAMVHGAAEDLVSDLSVRGAKRGKTLIRDSDCCLEDLNDMLLRTDLDHLILRELTDTLVKMERITDSVCCARISSGVSTGPWTEFAPLLAPLNDRHLYLPALLPAFEWIRSHTGGIHMVGCPRTPTPHESAKWESWFLKYSDLCDSNPAISRFLDPAYILWEEGPGVAPSAVAAAMAVVDNQLSIQIPNPPSPVASLAGAGGVCVRLFETRGLSTAVASQIASAYRSHLAVPGVPGGGEIGPACRIVTFSAANLRWW